MFATSLGRVARATPTLTSSCTAAHRQASSRAATAASNASQATRRPLQRRHSSSKAPCPPNNSNGGKPEQAAPSDAAAVKSGSGRVGRGRGRPRLGEERLNKGRMGRVGGEKDEAFRGLPSVPSTQHLLPSDVSLSTFFALHRPISIQQTIPAPTDAQTFNSLFDPKPPRSTPSLLKQPGDVMSTLSSTISALEGESQEEGELRWEIVAEPPDTPNGGGGGIRHLDGLAKAKSIEQLVSQLRPYSPPPAPTPVDATARPQRQQQQAGPPKSKRLAHRHDAEPREKIFRTTLTVIETSHNGKKTWTAQTTPLVQLPSPGSTAAADAADVSADEPARRPSGQPFLHRLRLKQGRWERYRQGRRRAAAAAGPRKMHAISVKRQRKLKMKKHKYKKLMKRTRNLRRRLDRT
ncbi:hypothetical protein LTR50_006391 [Elasticomyces elasticus]|nr:hypothetical protein LTR50_006391 [Elasticomyces elasticus]